MVEKHYTKIVAGESILHTDFIPFCKPSLGKDEDDAVLQVMHSGWLTTGAKAFEFEKQFAKFKGCKHAISVNSCTSALHLALLANGVGPGDAVITTPVTWPSTINAIIHCGAEPVFADVEQDTLNINPDLISPVLEMRNQQGKARAKAILVVHMAGYPCRMDAIMRVAHLYNLKVIEDSAHAIEAEYSDRKTGTIGDAGCFSFYPTKNITTGEGGMVTTNDDGVAEFVKVYSFNGIDRDAWRRYGSDGYRHWEAVFPGYKYNLPDTAAAIGLVQLNRIWKFWERRQAIANYYDTEFAGVSGLETLSLRRRNKLNCLNTHVLDSYHLYIVALDLDKLDTNRDVIMNEIQASGIGVGVHFRSLHLHKCYTKYGYGKGSLPNAEWAADRIVSLPLYPALTDAEVYRVTDTVKSVLIRHSK